MECAVRGGGGGGWLAVPILLPTVCVCVCVQITKCGRIKTLLLLVHLRASQLFNTPPLRTPV